MSIDLRHLALILAAGAKAAKDIDDVVLAHTLDQMAETAVAYHTEAFNLDADFAKLAQRYQ